MPRVMLVVHHGLPSTNFPRYVCPEEISTVTWCPCHETRQLRHHQKHRHALRMQFNQLTVASLSSLIGMPIVEVMMGYCMRSSHTEELES